MTRESGRLADVPTSTQQHRYYRGVILRQIAKHCGYESLEEAHRALKAGFYELHPDDPTLPSMATMNGEETGRFLDYALRQAAEMSLVIDEPRGRGHMGRL